jgi:hypothetical protein
MTSQTQPIEPENAYRNYGISLKMAYGYCQILNSAVSVCSCWLYSLFFFFSHLNLYFKALIACMKEKYKEKVRSNMWGIWNQEEEQKDDEEEQEGRKIAIKKQTYFS